MRNTIFSSRGGAEVQAEFIREACVRAGYEVHFASDVSKNEITSDSSTTYHVLPNHGRLQSWRNFFAINKLVKKIRPEIIYQRVRFSYTGLAAFYAKKYGALFVHNISADYACQKNSVPIDMNFVSSFITEHLGRYGIKSADLVISQTEIQARKLNENFGIGSIVIPNGHPVASPPFEKDSTPLIAWVANIKEWKRPEVFIELAERLSDIDANFVLAGKPAGGAFQEKFLRRVGELQNIEYLGQLSQEEVNLLLSRSAIFVNTSQPREGFPNTFIQAWMRETPVVSLSFDPDNINTTKNIGYLSGNIDQLELDVRELLGSKEQLKEMGKKAREYSEQNFDCKITGSAYIREFEKLQCKWEV